MSIDESGKIACASCDRRYAWKQAYAGRSVKCKCGATIVIPHDDPAADAGAYDLLAPADDVVTPPTYRPAGAPAQAPSAALPRAAAPMRIPGPARGAKFDDHAARSHEIKKMAAIGGGIALLVALVVGGRFAFRALGPADTRNLPAHDGRVARLVKDEGGFEVLAWLKENPRRGVVGFFWTREKTEARAKDWYAHGAKTVLAFGGVMTASLAIELPDDKERRKYLFDVAEQIRRERLSGQGQPDQTDIGQKYVVIDFL